MTLIKQIISAVLIAGKAFAILIFVMVALGLFMLLFIIMREVAWSIHEDRKRKLEEKRKHENDNV